MTSKVKEVVTAQEKPQPNKLNRLLERTKVLYKKFIYVDEDAFNIAVVWTAHTYLYKNFDYTPYFLIWSPERESGKSTFLEWIHDLSSNSEYLSGTSPSALLRLGDESRPSLFVDELDSTLSSKSLSPEEKDLTGILNSGFKVGGSYLKQIPVKGEDANWKPKHFGTFYPKAFASIGTDCLPDATRSRCIMVQMNRKTASDSKNLERNIKRIRDKYKDEIEEIKAGFREWAKESTANELIVDLPMELSDRAIDIYEPLLQIGHEAGGDWYNKVMEGAIHLSGRKNNAIELGTQFLIDVHDITKDMEDDDWIQTTDLINYLCDNKYADSGWSTYSKGNPISARALAVICRKYNIEVKKTNVGSGYVVRNFTKAIKSYAMEHIVTPEQSTTSTTSNTNKVAQVVVEKNVNTFRKKDLLNEK